ncbi:Ribosomal RNA small subunit methyltransferase B [Capillimicrobium parvum]|uniref:16S rRNA (cytosine(967)-C(5))-methyltransferase n=1 Tax=Capillimicrobium parvum TaxID=2884022 RepID=A0A9E7BZY5_9ACTN|nr:Ribosomal RNA small subunit methyltransferase B [Capillimicrobium parvum]
MLRRVFEQGAYADRALRKVAEGLDARDRAFATQLAFGAVQRRGTLDHVAAHLADRPVDRLDPPVAAALRLGLFQILYLDGVPDHAAVDESVELVKADAPRAAGLVNAVLRRGADEGPRIVAALTDETPEQAAIRHSVPEWLARLWFDELGPDEARALLAAGNQPAEHALRANALVLTARELLARLPVAAHLGLEPEEAIVADAPFDAHGSPLFAAGAMLPQSRASQLVAHAVDPQPGDRVLDLCAAPGGKTTHLAALTGDEGRIVAVERHAGRADQLRATARRLHAGSVEVVHGDAAAFTAAEPFDRVLVDPPCSGLGTLRSRPDLRWRATPQSIAELTGEQRAIIDAAANALAPGGRLVYSTCTLSTAENERQIDALLARRPDLALDQVRTTLPHRDRTDGFFIAALSRTL